MKTVRSFIAISLLFIVCARFASGYAIAPPSVRVVASANGRTLVRIDPGSLEVQSRRHARLQLFQQLSDEDDYRLIRAFDLRNPIAPDAVAVSNDGAYIATCDDWDPKKGMTENVIVLYRSNGDVIRSWTLEEVLSPEEIELLTQRFINITLRKWRSAPIAFMNQDAGVPKLCIPTDDVGDHQWVLLLDVESHVFQRVHFPSKEAQKRLPSRQKAAEPGATDNPDDAQRLREDH